MTNNVASGFGRSIDPAPEGGAGETNSIAFWKNAVLSRRANGIFITGTELTYSGIYAEDQTFRATAPSVVENCFI